MEHQLAGLNQIYNLLILSENLTTAGQPSDEELRLVARCGFNVVINLALAEMRSTSGNSSLMDGRCTQIIRKFKS